MKVIARIKGEDQELLENLNAGNIVARRVKNAIIVDLPQLSKIPASFAIPDLLVGKDIIYFIECTENLRGDFADKKVVTLVCDKAGQPMKPYYISKTTNKDAAYFAIPKCVTILTSAERVVIEEHYLEKDKSGYTITLIDRVMWEGEDVNALPEAFSRFKEVIDASYLKLLSDEDKVFYAQGVSK